MERRVLYAPSVSTQLCRRFGVARMTINRAMRFKTNSDLAQRIREVAIKEFGCLVYQPSKKITQ